MKKRFEKTLSIRMHNSMSHALRKMSLGSRRADMVAQIFVYALSLIIVGLVLMFGYKAILYFIDSGCVVEMTKFKKDTQGYVASYINDFGSIGYKSINAPCKATEICFTDYNWNKGMNLIDCDNSALQGTKAALKDYYSSSGREKKNVFLFDVKGTYLDGWYMGNITLEPKASMPNGCNYLCMKSIRGGFSIKMVGRGNHVIVSNGEWG